MFGNNNGGGNTSSNHLMQMQRLAMQANRNQRNNSNTFNYNSNQNSNDLSTNNCGTNDMENFNNMWASRSANNNHPIDNGNNTNNFGIFGGGQMMSHAQNAATINQTFMNASGNGSQMRAPYIFKCPECSLLKNSCDDLEIHIKTEHLNWLPFNCPLCTACRASDNQMREHIHSHHKKNDNKYFYVDNPMAKRMLQEMMDRALFSASSHAASQAARQRNHFPNSNNSQFNNNSPSSQFTSSSSNNNFNNNFANNQATSPTSSAEMLDRYLQSAKRNRLAPNSSNQLNHSAIGRRNSNEFRREDMQVKGTRQESSHSPNGEEEDIMPIHSVNNTLGVTVLTKKSSTAEDLLAKLQSSANTKDMDDSQEGQSVTEGGSNNILEERDLFADTNEIVDDETNAQLSQIFGNNHIKSEFDLSSMEVMDNNSTTSSLLRQTMNANDGGLDDGLHNMDVLQNVAAMFSVDQRDAGEYGQNGSNNSQFIQMMRRRAPRGSKGGVQCISKKRVLGQCNKCLKPVTAGARQMHMFFHLGKDHDTYRFRCKHPNCTVEHYRKDQMENHQAKTHGKVDLDMMEDRSLELHSLCQEMSMELLGTKGNAPGPTAEKAQILYDKMQEEAEISALRKRRRGTNGGGMFNSRSHSYFGNNRNFLNNTSQYQNSNLQQSLPVKRPLDPRQRINEENLECLLCHKYIMNRIRGFHILWHLNNDLGIIRYNCKFCDFKHDRPQSVTTHGKKEHDDENCMEDSLYKFEDEVKSMSKACFGIEQLFAKEVRRRNRLERNEKAMIAEQQELLGISLNIGNITDSGLEELGDIETNSNDTNSTDMVQLGGSSKSKNSSFVVSPKEKARTSGGASATNQPQGSAQKSNSARRSTRRFGVRRPKSRKQKIEMAKLREISMRLGGAQYFKKKSTDSVPCEGHQSRDMILKHLRDFHSSNEQPTDNRLKFAKEIKDAIRECYPSCFVDAPIPTAADIERLKANLNLSDKALACATFENDNDNEEEDKGSENGDDDEEPDDNESSNSKSNEAKNAKVEGEEEDDGMDDEEEPLQIQEEGNTEDDDEEQEEDDEEEETAMDADEEEPEESTTNGEGDE